MGLNSLSVKRTLTECAVEQCGIVALCDGSVVSSDRIRCAFAYSTAQCVSDRFELAVARGNFFGQLDRYRFRDLGRSLAARIIICVAAGETVDCECRADRVDPETLCDLVEFSMGEAAVRDPFVKAIAVVLAN